MPQFKVKIKDHEQQITHFLSVWAKDQREANAMALIKARRMLNAKPELLEIM